MKLLRSLILAMAALCLGFAAAHAEKRVALVLGNSDYRHALKLPNPARDAVAMAALLRNLGFEVVTGTDLGRTEMAAKLGEFATLAQEADAAVVFYAGHGIAVDGKNYLIPIDAELKTEMDVKLGSTIDADVALQQTLATAKVKLVFLDACRDNPFARQINSAAPATRGVVVSSGLAEMKPGQGTLIAFATGPGETALDGSGSNSPFTRALLEHLANPGVEIRQAMTLVRAQVNRETGKQQLPWENTNLTGFFYMNPAPGGAQVAMADPAAPAASTDVELEFWKTVKDSNSPEELNAYLTRFPSGAFASIARARIAALENATAPAAAVPSEVAPAAPVFVPDPAIKIAEASLATEDALGLDKAARAVAQKKLNALGFATGGTNGKFGAKTRIGVAGWQLARGYPATGYLNRLQHEALMAEPAPVASAQPAGEPAVRSTGVKKRKPSTVAAPQKKRKAVASSGGGKKVKRRRGTAGQAGEFIGGIIRGAF